MTRSPEKPLHIDPLPLFSDRPEEAARLFHFDALVATLTGMLTARDNPTPFVFLVDGRWGTGKTSLMRTVIRAVEPVCGAAVIEAARLPEDDEGLRLVENNPLRWAPVAAIEHDAGSVWRSTTLASDDTGADCQEECRDARKRVRWLARNLKDRYNELKPVGADWAPTAATTKFFDRFRPVRSVFFNAWKYKDEGEIFPALAHELLAEMRASGWLARMQAFSQEAASADWREAIAQLAEAVPHAGNALATGVRRPEWLQQVALYDRARPFLQGLTAAWATSYGLRADSAPRRIREMLRDDVRKVFSHLRALRAPGELKEQALPGIVAVFIDDLDRCPAEHVAAVLKALNLLVDLEMSAWVVGADHERVAEAVSGQAGRSGAGDDYGGKFLGKIVQLHLVLPEGARDEAQQQGYVHTLLGLDDDGGTLNGSSKSFPLDRLRNLRGLLVAGLPPNPRRVKELLNQAVSQLALLKPVLADQDKHLDDAWAQAALKYLLVIAHLPRGLRGNHRFIEALQVRAAAAPSGEGGSWLKARRASREGIEEGGELATQLVGEGTLTAKEAELLALVDADAWSRLGKILAWHDDGKDPVPLDGERLQTFLTLGIARAVAGASERSEPDEAQAAGRVAAAREQEQGEERRRAAEAAETVVRPLIVALRDARTDEAAVTELLAAVTRSQVLWQPSIAEVLPDTLSNHSSAEQRERVMNAGQGALARALDDPAMARRENELAWAMALRDAAVDLLDREGKNDPWLQRWQKEEAKRINHQHGGADAEDLVKGSWRLVPAGPFIAGGVLYDDELPVRIESVATPFWIEEHPVTVARFAEFLEAQGGAYDLEQAYWRSLEAAGEALGKRRQPQSWNTQSIERRLDHPVVGVSWFEAAAFCAWRAAQGHQERLPSEAEWEKAARGVLGRRWPWGCAWRGQEVVCSEDDAAARELSAVSINRNTSPFGARGMAGNCWEWTSSAWSDRGFGAPLGTVEQPGPADRQQRVTLRGGSFFNDRIWVRCAGRGRGSAEVADSGIGFRCVRDADTP